MRRSILLTEGMIKKTPKGEDPEKGGVPYKITGKMTQEAYSLTGEMISLRL